MKKKLMLVGGTLALAALILTGYWFVFITGDIVLPGHCERMERRCFRTCMSGIEGATNLDGVLCAWECDMERYTCDAAY